MALGTRLSDETAVGPDRGDEPAAEAWIAADDALTQAEMIKGELGSQVLSIANSVTLPRLLRLE